MNVEFADWRTGDPFLFEHCCSCCGEAMAHWVTDACVAPEFCESCQSCTVACHPEIAAKVIFEKFRASVSKLFLIPTPQPKWSPLRKNGSTRYRTSLTLKASAFRCGIGTSADLRYGEPIAMRPMKRCQFLWRTSGVEIGTLKIACNAGRTCIS